MASALLGPWRGPQALCLKISLLTHIGREAHSGALRSEARALGLPGPAGELDLERVILFFWASAPLLTEPLIQPSPSHSQEDTVR